MIDSELAIQIIVIGAGIMFGGAAALALGWSLSDGQFDNFERGSHSIFGPDEPVGIATDAFPAKGGR